MDWFTWLSKTNLDPSLAYEYARNFTHNELGEDDITHFSHEFLQSMGVTIAKHRLEILKLARKEKTQKVHPILWFILAIKQTKNYLTSHIRTLVHRENRTLSLVPKRSHSLRWKVAMLQRNKRWRVPSAKQEWTVLRDGSPRLEAGPRTLMLTTGGPLADSQSSGSSESSGWLESEANVESGHITRANPWSSSFASTMAHYLDHEYWSSSTEEIKWDSMFQNLKPT